MVKIFGQFGKMVKIKTLWLYLFLVKLLFSVLLVIPFFLSSNSILASSLHSRPLIADWDLGVIAEMFAGRSEILPVYLIGILIGAIIFVFVIQFLNGGLYFLVISGEISPVKWREFFVECGLRFPTHLKISLLMLVIYMFLLPAGLFLVNMLGVFGTNLMGTGAIIFMIFKMGIIFLILLAASVFSDSIRASSAAFPDKRFTDLVKMGANFYRPNMFRMVGIFLVTYIPFLIIWGVVELLSRGVSTALAGMTGIIIEFVLFQIASFTRTGQKLWFLIFFGSRFRENLPGRFLPEQVQMNL